MGNTFKLVHIQPFMIRILGGFAQLDVQQGNPVLVRPVYQRLTEVFRIIVTTQRRRLVPPLDDLL